MRWFFPCSIFVWSGESKRLDITLTPAGRSTIGKSSGLVLVNQSRTEPLYDLIDRVWRGLARDVTVVRVPDHISLIQQPHVAKTRLRLAGKT